MYIKPALYILSTYSSSEFMAKPGTDLHPRRPCRLTPCYIDAHQNLALRVQIPTLQTSPVMAPNSHCKHTRYVLRVRYCDHWEETAEYYLP